MSAALRYVEPLQRPGSRPSDGESPSPIRLSSHLSQPHIIRDQREWERGIGGLGER